MNPQLDEFRNFPEPFILVNDDVVHPFSSSKHAQTINQPFNGLPGASDLSFYSNITFESAQSIESDNNITNRIENDNHIDQENYFIQQLIKNKKPFHINQFDFIYKNLNKIFKYLQIESKKVQQITENFQK